MRSRKALQATVTGTAVAFCTAVTPVWAQNSPVSGNLSFSTSLSVDNNPTLRSPSSGAVFDVSENLGFSIRTENSIEFLEFSGSTGLSFSSTAGSGSSTVFNKPQGTLHYFRDGVNANIDVSASFWSGDVISSFDADPSIAVNIIVDTGTLQTTSAAMVANWGLTGPVNYSFSASHVGNNYTGTTDPGLIDHATTVLAATASMRLTPTTQASFSLVRSADQISDAFSTLDETADYGFQITHQANQTLTLNANLSYQVQAATFAGATTVSEGVFGGVGFVQALPTGSIFGDVAFDAVGASNSGSATIGRSIDFPLGTLTGSVTADWDSVRGTQVLGAASFNRQFPDGSLDVQFSQSVTTDNLSQDVKYTYIGIGYQKTLNSDSGIDLSLDVSRSEDAGGGAAATVNRATLTTAYSRALNSDWNMSVGYSHRHYSGSAVTTANSDSVFFTLTKNLQFGF